jgi:ankyrin repeat protein
LETKIDVIDDTGMTALLWFIMAGNVEMVDLLLKEDAGIEALDFEGRTPLMWIAANVNRQPQILEFASRLLTHHARVDVVDYNGDTALILAADNIIPGIVRVLLESGADVNFANENDGTTALLRAAGNRNSEIMKILLEKDAKFDICDKKGFTPVMAAAKHGQETNLRKLLSLDADAKAIDRGDYTALKYALENKKAGAVRILVEHGAHVGTAALDAGDIFLSLLGDGAAHGLGAKEKDKLDSAAPA